MNTNHAHALTHAALVSLQEALDLSENPDDFFAEADAIIKVPENVLQLPVDLGTPEALNPGANVGGGRDVENAPLVFEFLGAMDRSNAADRRLWTYLAFSTYRSYMEKRWDPSESSNWKSRVTDRWLMSNATRGKLIRHGVARLWWVASLTYDAKRQYALSIEDPFGYTREVFRNEDRINSLFDREVGANPSIVRAVLEHAAKGGAYGRDKHLAALMKELRLIYGYRDIGTLDPKTTQELIAEYAPPLNPKK